MERLGSSGPGSVLGSRSQVEVGGEAWGRSQASSLRSSLRTVAEEEEEREGEDSQAEQEGGKGRCHRKQPGGR